MSDGFKTEVFSYEQRQWEKPITHYQRNNLGKNATRTTVCGFEGFKAYVKEGNILGGAIVASNVASAIFMEEAGVEHPDIVYDEEADKVMVQEVEDSIPGHDLEEVKPETDSLHEQLAVRALLGDKDVYKNILAYPADEPQSFVNIDFEYIGHSVDEFFDENEDSIRKLLESAGAEDSWEEIDRQAENIAEGIDIRRLRERFDESPYVQESWKAKGPASVQQIIGNVRRYS